MEGELEWEGEVDTGLVTKPRRSRAEKVGVGEEMAENGAQVSVAPKENGAKVTNGEKETAAQVTDGEKENGAEESVEVTNGGKDNGAEESFHPQKSVYLDVSEGIESSIADVGNNLETLYWRGGNGKWKKGAAFEDKDVTPQNGLLENNKPSQTFQKKNNYNNNKHFNVADMQLTSHLIYSRGHEIEAEKAERMKNVTNEFVPAKQDKADFDLERVIEEQETHDLYCPNCRSCITKRVILRKRKRLSQVVQNDAKREKLESIQSDLGVSDSEEREEPEVFRCLSCFSFFTSTASGFRLFRIFQRRGETDNLHTPQPPPAQNLNAASTSSQSVVKPDAHKTDVGGESENPLFGEDNLRTEPEKMHSDDNTVGLGSEAPLSSEGKETEAAMKHPGVGSYYSSTTTTVTVQNISVNYPDNELLNAGKQGNGITLHVKEDEINGWSPSSNLSQSLLGEKNASFPSIVEGSDNAKPLKEGTIDPTKQLVSQPVEDPPISSMPVVSSDRDIQINLGDPQVVRASTRQWDVLKSIVYGGLVESITSLGVVSSAAGSDAATLKVVALGLANLVAGLIVLAQNLNELMNDHRETLEVSAEENSRYYRTLGRIANKRLHIFVAILSYIIFGIIPPVVYGFSFRESDHKEYKLIAVAGASLLCILLLSIGKAHVQRGRKPYIKTILFHLSVGIASSGLAYVAGELVKRLLENSSLFDASGAGSVPSPPSVLDMKTTKSGWESF